jgi:hypothetical protein
MKTLIYKKSDTALEILESMRGTAFDPDSFGSMENYIDWLQDHLWRMHAIHIPITGSQVEDRASSMVSGLIEKGLIELE